jgi:hypothetical protein
VTGLGPFGHAVVFGGAVVLACGAADFTVPRYPQPDSVPAEPVAFPPPPAQIENLEALPPAPGCLWLDGQWLWATQRWEWRAGGWVRPPEGCQYSAPEAPRWAATDGAGVLYYRPGGWYSIDTARACPYPVSCPTTKSPPNPN